MKKCVVALLLLTGCAAQQYSAGPEATMSLSRARGACKLAAIQATNGEEGLSAGVMLRSAYDGCMQANGFVPAP